MKHLFIALAALFLISTTAQAQETTTMAQQDLKLSASGAYTGDGTASNNERTQDNATELYGRLKHASLDVTHEDFSESTNATAETLAFAAALHATLPALITHAWIELTTPFSGGTVDSCTAAVGTDEANDVDALVEETSVFTGVTPGHLASARGARLAEATYQPIVAAGAKPTVTFLPGTDDPVALTAGACTVHVLYRLLDELG